MSEELRSLNERIVAYDRDCNELWEQRARLGHAKEGLAKEQEALAVLAAGLERREELLRAREDELGEKQVTLSEKLVIINGDLERWKADEDRRRKLADQHAEALAHWLAERDGGCEKPESEPEDETDR